mmetsp:Transcript_23924/g.60528  ORF Transcript_23924/g.60528 Transcript_23924/m.60528 type:complete len:233 (+) Transcript_23924:1330-2028(+)
MSFLFLFKNGSMSGKKHQVKDGKVKIGIATSLAGAGGEKEMRTSLAEKLNAADSMEAQHVVHHLSVHRARRGSGRRSSLPVTTGRESHLEPQTEKKEGVLLYEAPGSRGTVERSRTEKRTPERKFAGVFCQVGTVIRKQRPPLEPLLVGPRYGHGMQQEGLNIQERGRGRTLGNSVDPDREESRTHHRDGTRRRLRLRPRRGRGRGQTGLGFRIAAKVLRSLVGQHGVDFAL